MPAALAPQPTPRHLPQRVLLLSGHRVDDPGRTPPRFTSAQVPAATRAVAQVLADIDAGPGDLALTQGASGADILWAEAALARGVALQLLLPLPEPEFLAQSVLPSADGSAWARRYLLLRERCVALPEVIITTPTTADGTNVDFSPFRACNDALLARALSLVPATQLHLLCLWDGQLACGPGGTAELVQAVQAAGGQLHGIHPGEVDTARHP
jgi:hypothetical protein